jgi:predicted MFS family arabinose efflux permease
LPAISFLVLTAAAFLSSVGARVTDPLLAVLADQFHSSIGAVSGVLAAFTLPYGAMQLLIGPLGDRWGKLRMMAATTLAFGLAMLGCAFAASLDQLVVLRMLTGAAASGLIPLSLALIGDRLPYHQRQIAISRVAAGFTLGQMMAGPLGGVFGDTLGWRGVFLALGFASLVVFALLARQAARQGEPRRAHRFDLAQYRLLAARPAARILLLASLVEGALFAGSFPFVAPYLRFHWGLSNTAVGLLLAWFGAGGLLYAGVAKRLVPALGERRLVMLGGALVCAGLLGTAQAGHWQMVAVYEAILGFGYFTAHGVLLARATELLPHARSTAVSIFALMLFLGQSAGALGLGSAVELIGYRTALFGIGCGAALLTLWLAWIVRSPAPCLQQA